MPNPVLFKPQFANVPDEPGVPLIERDDEFPPDEPPDLEEVDGQVVLAAPQFPVWGIFDINGNLVVEPDSVFDFGYRADARVSNFPVQDGAFASYNKVKNPFEATVRITKGGSENDRAAFLSTVESLAESIELFDIVTPEKTYLNANITMQQYRRDAREGANLIVIDLLLVEIRQVSPQYSQVIQAPQSDSGTPPVNGGKVQPAPVPQSVLKSLANKAGS